MHRNKKSLQVKLARISKIVRLKGLEPPRREASDPKSDVATNYTTAALISSAKVCIFHYTPNFRQTFFRKKSFFLENGQ